MNTLQAFAFVGYQALLIFGIQIIGWIISCTLKTEKIFDCTGSLTFCLSVAMAILIKILVFNSEWHWRYQVISQLVCTWAIRLGCFLYWRAYEFGDSRFEEAKKKPSTFLIFWLLQAVWILVTILPSIFIIMRAEKNNQRFDRFGWFDGIGIALFVAGFVLETTADWQKSNFKRNPDNRGKFISSGCFRHIRYPNYLGEFLIWWGIFVFGCQIYERYEFLLALSPIYIMLQIIFVSGIRIQERQARERWAEDADYQAYRRHTDCCFLKIFD